MNDSNYSQKIANRKCYPLVNITRLVMSILVVALHTYVFKDVNYYLNGIMTACITRIAVPVFFIYTGYFLGNDIWIAKKRIYKMLRLYIIWSVVYLPFSFSDIMRGG